MVDIPTTEKYAEGSLIEPEYLYDKCEICPQCGRKISGGYWKSPRSVALSKQNLPDFLYIYGGSTAFLISEKALNVINKAELTGISCIEEIEHLQYQRKSKKENPIPKYYYFEVMRSKISIDHEKSKISYGRINENERCTLCNPIAATYDFFKSTIFNTDNYEGYDIFKTYELGDSLILSERFVDVCNKNGLSGLNCILAEEYDSQFSDWLGFDSDIFN